MQTQTKAWDPAELIRSHISGHLLGGLYLTCYPSGVVNVEGRTRDLDWEDVEIIRSAVAQAGRTVTEEWLPSAGMSWLSDGVLAGVSFRTVETGR